MAQRIILVLEGARVENHIQKVLENRLKDGSGSRFKRSRALYPVLTWLLNISPIINRGQG